MPNVMLRGGMYPLFHCRCKRAVLTTADGICLNCEKGLPPKTSNLEQFSTHGPIINWQILRAKGTIR